MAYTSFERSINARKQLRDSHGRWIEMFSEVKYLFDGLMRLGQIVDISNSDNTVNVLDSKDNTIHTVSHDSVTAISSKGRLKTAVESSKATLNSEDTSNLRTDVSRSVKSVSPDADVEAMVSPDGSEYIKRSVDDAEIWEKASEAFSSVFANSAIAKKLDDTHVVYSDTKDSPVTDIPTDPIHRSQLAHIAVANVLIGNDSAAARKANARNAFGIMQDADGNLIQEDLDGAFTTKLYSPVMLNNILSKNALYDNVTDADMRDALRSVEALSNNDIDDIFSDSPSMALYIKKRRNALLSWGSKRGFRGEAETDEGTIDADDFEAIDDTHIKDSNTGEIFEVLSFKTADEAMNSVLTSKLRKLAGAESADQRLAYRDNKLVALRSTDDTATDYISSPQSTEDKLWENYGVDAWLDSRGYTDFNTRYTEDGIPVREDFAGDLAISPGHMKKNKDLSTDMSAFTTLRNPNSSKAGLERAYEDMSDDQAKQSLAKVADISDQDIIDTVNSVYHPDQDKDRATELSNALIMRRDAAKSFMSAVRPADAKKAAAKVTTTKNAKTANNVKKASSGSKINLDDDIFIKHDDNLWRSSKTKSKFSDDDMVTIAKASSGKVKLTPRNPDRSRPARQSVDSANLEDASYLHRDGMSRLYNGKKQLTDGNLDYAPKGSTVLIDDVEYTRTALGKWSNGSTTFSNAELKDLASSTDNVGAYIPSRKAPAFVDRLARNGDIVVNFAIDSPADLSLIKKASSGSEFYSPLDSTNRFIKQDDGTWLTPSGEFITSKDKHFSNLIDKDYLEKTYGATNAAVLSKVNNSEGMATIANPNHSELPNGSTLNMPDGTKATRNDDGDWVDPDGDIVDAADATSASVPEKNLPKDVTLAGDSITKDVMDRSPVESVISKDGTDYTKTNTQAWKDDDGNILEETDFDDEDTLSVPENQAIAPKSSTGDSSIARPDDGPADSVISDTTPQKSVDIDADDITPPTPAADKIPVKNTSLGTDDGMNMPHEMFEALSTADGFDLRDGELLISDPDKAQSTIEGLVTKDLLDISDGSGKYIADQIKSVTGKDIIEDRSGTSEPSVHSLPTKSLAQARLYTNTRDKDNGFYADGDGTFHATNYTKALATLDRLSKDTDDITPSLIPEYQKQLGDIRSVIRKQQLANVNITSPIKDKVTLSSSDVRSRLGTGLTNYHKKGQETGFDISGQTLRVTDVDKATEILQKLARSSKDDNVKNAIRDLAYDIKRRDSIAGKGHSPKLKNLTDTSSDLLKARYRTAVLNGEDPGYFVDDKGDIHVSNKSLASTSILKEAHAASSKAGKASSDEDKKNYQDASKQLKDLSDKYTKEIEKLKGKEDTTNDSGKRSDSGRSSGNGVDSGELREVLRSGNKSSDSGDGLSSKRVEPVVEDVSTSVENMDVNDFSEGLFKFQNDNPDVGNSITAYIESVNGLDGAPEQISASKFNKLDDSRKLYRGSTKDTFKQYTSDKNFVGTGGSGSGIYTSNYKSRAASHGDNIVEMYLKDDANIIDGYALEELRQKSLTNATTDLERFLAEGDLARFAASKGFDGYTAKPFDSYGDDEVYTILTNRAATIVKKPTDPKKAETKTPSTKKTTTTGIAHSLEELGVERTEPKKLEGEDYPPTREQQDVIDAVLAGTPTVSVQAKAGTGKALRWDQFVVTPQGYRKICDLTIGSEVSGTDGQVYHVTGFYPQGVRPLYTVEFSDGSTVVADRDHRWYVEDAYGESSIRLTHELHNQLYIPHTNSVIFNNYTKQQRLVVLARMLSPVKREDTYTYTSQNIEDIRYTQFLAESLGGEARITHSNGEYHLFVDLQPHQARRITSVTPTTPDEAICITVDSPNHLFLTNHFIPTHNTSTVVALAKRIPKDKKAIYIAFNSSVADEAKGRMPDNTAAMTGHSLALRWIKDSKFSHILERSPLSGYSNKNKKKLVRAKDIAEHIGITDSDVAHVSRTNHLGEEYTVDLEGAQLYYAARNVVGVFQRSDRNDVSMKDVELSGDTPLDEESAQTILKAAKNLWEDRISEDGMTPTEHDTYRKVWAMQEPDLATQSGFGKRDFLILDEAQDTPPVLSKLINSQKNLQKVIVGDSDQAIYGFAGNEDFFKSVDTDAELFLTESFRFGQGIADVGNAILDVKDKMFPNTSTAKHIVGTKATSTVKDVLEDPKAILVRKNKTLVEVLSNALLEGKENITVPKGTRTNLIKMLETAKALKNGNIRELDYSLKDKDMAIQGTWGNLLKAQSKGDHSLDLAVGLFRDMDTKDMESLREKLNSVYEDIDDKAIYLKPSSKLAGGQIFDIANSYGAVDESKWTKGFRNNYTTKSADEYKKMTDFAETIQDKYEQSDLAISTAHKSKGLEWDSVQLADDFPNPDENDLTEEDLKLLYVAVTRGKNAVGLGSAGWIKNKDDDNHIDIKSPNPDRLKKAEMDATKCAITSSATTIDTCPFGGDTGYTTRDDGSIDVHDKDRAKETLEELLKDSESENKDKDEDDNNDNKDDSSALRSMIDALLVFDDDDNKKRHKPSRLGINWVNHLPFGLLNGPNGLDGMGLPSLPFLSDDAAKAAAAIAAARAAGAGAGTAGGAAGAANGGTPNYNSSSYAYAFAFDLLNEAVTPEAESMAKILTTSATKERNAATRTATNTVAKATSTTMNNPFVSSDGLGVVNVLSQSGDTSVVDIPNVGQYTVQTSSLKKYVPSTDTDTTTDADYTTTQTAWGETVAIGDTVSLLSARTNTTPEVDSTTTEVDSTTPVLDSTSYRVLGVGADDSLVVADDSLALSDITPSDIQVVSSRNVSDLVPSTSDSGTSTSTSTSTSVDTLTPETESSVNSLTQNAHLATGTTLSDAMEQARKIIGTKVNTDSIEEPEYANTTASPRTFTGMQVSADILASIPVEDGSALLLGSSDVITKNEDGTFSSLLDANKTYTLSEIAQRASQGITYAGTSLVTSHINPTEDSLVNLSDGSRIMLPNGSGMAVKVSDDLWTVTSGTDSTPITVAGSSYMSTDDLLKAADFTTHPGDVPVLEGSVFTQRIDDAPVGTSFITPDNSVATRMSGDTWEVTSGTGVESVDHTQFVADTQNIADSVVFKQQLDTQGDYAVGTVITDPSTGKTYSVIDNKNTVKSTEAASVEIPLDDVTGLSARAMVIPPTEKNTYAAIMSGQASELPVGLTTGVFTGSVTATKVADNTWAITDPYDPASSFTFTDKEFSDLVKSNVRVPSAEDVEFLTAADGRVFSKGQSVSVVDSDGKSGKIVGLSSAMEGAYVEFPDGTIQLVPLEQVLFTGGTPKPNPMPNPNPTPNPNPMPNPLYPDDEKSDSVTGTGPFDNNVVSDNEEIKNLVGQVTQNIADRIKNTQQDSPTRSRNTPMITAIKDNLETTISNISSPAVYRTEDGNFINSRKESKADVFSKIEALTAQEQYALQHAVRKLKENEIDKLTGHTGRGRGTDYVEKLRFHKTAYYYKKLHLGGDVFKLKGTDSVIEPVRKDTYKTAQTFIEETFTPVEVTEDVMQLTDALRGYGIPGYVKAPEKIRDRVTDMDDLFIQNPVSFYGNTMTKSVSFMRPDGTSVSSREELRQMVGSIISDAGYFTLDGGMDIVRNTDPSNNDIKLLVRIAADSGILVTDDYILLPRGSSLYIDKVDPAPDMDTVWVEVVPMQWIPPQIYDTSIVED